MAAGGGRHELSWPPASAPSPNTEAGAVILGPGSREQPLALEAWQANRQAGVGGQAVWVTNAAWCAALLGARMLNL